MRVGLSVSMLFLLSLTFAPAARADVPNPDGGPPSTSSTTSGSTGSTGSGAGGAGGAGTGGNHGETTTGGSTVASSSTGPAAPAGSNGVNCAMGTPSSSWGGATLFGLAAAGALSLRRRRASASRDARRALR